MTCGPGEDTRDPAFTRHDILSLVRQRLYGLVADYAPQGAAGRAFGISFFLSFGLGSFAATFAGLVATRWGTGAAFTVLAIVSAVLTALVLLVLRGAEQRRAAEAAASVATPA